MIGKAFLIFLVLTFGARGETCRASFYASGRITASGERFRPLGFTAAHRNLPFGTRLLVSLGSKSLVLRVNDRGPFIPGRCLDLSLGSAKALGLNGVAQISWKILQKGKTMKILAVLAWLLLGLLPATASTVMVFDEHGEVLTWGDSSKCNLFLQALPPKTLVIVIPVSE